METTAVIYLNPDRPHSFFKIKNEKEVKQFLNEYKSWKTRNVYDVEENENDLTMLENIFQTDWMNTLNSNTRSMCTGDITIVNNKIYICQSIGWACLGEI